MTSTQFTISGMTCDHCKRSVTESLSAVAGVASVEVSLEEKVARVEHSEAFDLAAARAAVVEAGYDIVP